MALLIPGENNEMKIVVFDDNGNKPPEVIGTVTNVEIAALLGDKKALAKLEEGEKQKNDKKTGFQW